MPLPYFPPAHTGALYAAIRRDTRRYLEITLAMWDEEENTPPGKSVGELQSEAHRLAMQWRERAERAEAESDRYREALEKIAAVPVRPGAVLVRIARGALNDE